MVIIKLVNGTKYLFNIEKFETLSSLKNKIAEFLQINKSTIRLIYNGQSLSDEFSLINLSNKSVIHLIYQLATIDE
jgi:hypothetical protein